MAPLTSDPRTMLAANLKRLRREKRLSQETLADLANLHRTFVGAVERRERNISLDNIGKLAAALEVTLATLLDEQQL